MKTNSFAFALMISGLALTSCATPEQDLQRASGICAAGGVTEGSSQFQSCVSNEVEKIQDNRAAMGAAIAAGFKSYGSSQASYQSNYQSTYRRPIHCTSNSVAGYVYTDCY